jgi:hypothetical protein
MATGHEIRPFSLVELTEAVDAAPAGAQGGVVDLIDRDTAIIEVMQPDLDGLDRIVVAAPSQLRLL